MISIEGHTVLPIAEEDIPILASFLQASKIQLAINRFMWQGWPNEVTAKREATKAIKGSLENAQMTSYKVLDDSTGAIVAHLALTRRSAKNERGQEGSAQEEKELPEGVVPEVLEKVIEVFKEINAGIEDLDRMELTWIYVAPASRGKGVGTGLVDLAKKQARDAGLLLSLVSEPPAHAFFVKQGLKDTKYADIDLAKWAPPYCGYGDFRVTGMIVEN